MIWVFNDYQVKGGDVRWIAAALTVYAGITMVSNVKFYSGKDINLRRAVPFWVVIVMVLVLLLISIEPSHVLWGVMVAYGLSGYVMWVVQRWRSEAAQKQYAHVRDAIEEGDTTGARAHARDHAARHGDRQGRAHAAHGRGRGGQPARRSSCSSRAAPSLEPARRAGRTALVLRRRDGVPGGRRGAARGRRGPQPARPLGHDRRSTWPRSRAPTTSCRSCCATARASGRELQPRTPDLPAARPAAIVDP